MMCLYHYNICEKKNSGWRSLSLCLDYVEWKNVESLLSEFSIGWKTIAFYLSSQSIFMNFGWFFFSLCLILIITDSCVCVLYVCVLIVYVCRYFFAKAGWLCSTASKATIKQKVKPQW